MNLVGINLDAIPFTAFVSQMQVCCPGLPSRNLITTDEDLTERAGTTAAATNPPLMSISASFRQGIEAAASRGWLRSLLRGCEGWMQSLREKRAFAPWLCSYRYVSLHRITSWPDDLFDPVASAVLRIGLKKTGVLGASFGSRHQWIGMFGDNT